MRSRIPLCLLVIVLAVPGIARGQHDAPDADYEWLQGFTLVELETTDVGSMHAAHALIRARGGTIALLSPPSLLLGWIPEDVAESVQGQKGIRAIHRNSVSPQKVGARDPQSNRMVRYFNAVVSGEYQRRAELRKASAGPPRFPHGGDGLLRDPIDEVSYLRNLADQGFDLNALRDRGILMGKAATDPERVQGQTDRMTGTSTVSIIFVESDGTGTDPNLYDWTNEDVQDYLNGVNTGLAWWSSQAPTYNNCWAAFFVRWFEPATDSRVNQSREMVLNGSNVVDNMAVDVMSNFGYNGGSHLSRVDAFNTAQCATYGTDWAYTAFVAYNPSPAPAELTDGRSAFAYLLGPYTFLLFRSYGWAPDQVFSHESGHIYGACDEYEGGCTCGNLCIGELNDNCADCGANVSCMMKSNTFTLCTYTDEQVGWQDSNPCAPPPLTPPTVTTVSPQTAFVGTSVQLTVTGTDFLYGVFCQLGSGVVIDKTTWVNATTALVDVTIQDAATPGMRNLTVTNRDLQGSTLTNAFEVLPTTRHYYSLSGNAVYPYVTVADAATTLADAIDAAAAGDSILVESGTLPFNSLTITKGVILYGGWINNFTQRDVVNSKTVLNLTSNVNILVTGGGTAGLDGFNLSNGTGTFRPSPVSGDYGGAVLVLSSSAQVSNCELSGNQTNGSAFGGGGAIFAENATVNVLNNTFTGNSATRGGAIYLRNSSGTVASNTIQTNGVAQWNTELPYGAAIAIEDCSSLVLQDNVIAGNTGADSGGGLKIINSSAISVVGGSIQSHSVVNNGGGVDVSGSEVVFSGVLFQGNSSDWTAGGLGAASGSDIEVANCSFILNSALFHGGLFSTGGDASVHHNLFVNNSATVSAGAMTLVNVGSGDVTGNTLDRNSAGGVAGILLDNAPIEVTNNIVSNNVGGGIACVNAPPTLIDWNLVTGNTGADYGTCVIGANPVVGNPLFADTTMTDYHLGLHSAAIDAGRPDVGFEDPDGSRGDLGIYGSHSFVMDQPAFPTGLTASLQGGNVILSWAPNAEPDVANYAVYANTSSAFKPDALNFVTAATDTMVDLGPLAGTTFYTIAAIDTAGYSSGFATEVQSPDATDAPPSSPGSFTFRLLANVPNPFNPITRIGFELDRRGAVQLEIYDLAGRRVQTLVNGERGAGPHMVVWDGRNHRGERVASGVYVYRLRSAGRESTRKLVVLK